MTSPSSKLRWYEEIERQFQEDMICYNCTMYSWTSWNANTLLADRLG